MFRFEVRSVEIYPKCYKGVHGVCLLSNFENQTIMNREIFGRFLLLLFNHALYDVFPNSHIE